jgi:cell division protein FtsQ
MNIKSPLKKIFMVIIWCLLGGSGLALLIAAINAKNSSLCNGVEVEINDGGKAVFLNKKDVIAMLESEGIRDLHNKKIASFDLLKMETTLRRNTWIKDAQLYFDNNQMLKLRIQERQPLARLFTSGGNSFLIDSAGVQMALAEKNAFRLPVFTGYPSEKFGLRRDSALDSQIRNLANFLCHDSFWSNQVQEINIETSKTFRLTPLIGNQAIEFGDGSQYENKFHKLFTFYKDVITQTGFEYYTSINVAFENQVIATRKQGSISRADSIQARKNVMDMIRLAQKMQSDTAKIRDIKPLEKNTMTEQTLRSYDLPEEIETNNNQTGTKHQQQTVKQTKP